MARRFPLYHPAWSHLLRVPPMLYEAWRDHYDGETAWRAAVIKTSHPDFDRPRVRPDHPSQPAPARESFPSAWTTFADPVSAGRLYMRAARQRFPQYRRDPVGALTADFQDMRAAGRFSDLAWRPVEEAVAKAPVSAAQAFDAAAPRQFTSGSPFNGQDPGAAEKALEPYKIAPRVERAMQPMRQDAALRPPRNQLELTVDGTSRGAMLVGCARGEASSA